MWQLSIFVFLHLVSVNLALSLSFVSMVALFGMKVLILMSVLGVIFFIMFCLGKAGFLRRNVAPFLDNWLLDLPWVGSGPGADLLRDINTFLFGFKFGHQFGHMLAGTLGLKGALFLRSILYNCLGFVITLLISFLESTSSWSTDLPGFLGTPSDWCTF